VKGENGYKKEERTISYRESACDWGERLCGRNVPSDIRGGQRKKVLVWGATRLPMWNREDWPDSGGKEKEN